MRGRSGLQPFSEHQAARFVQGLHARSTLVLAGNHDLPLYAWWLRWGRAYDRFAQQFGMDQEPVRQMGSFMWWA